MITYFHHINETRHGKKLFHHRFYWKTRKNSYHCEIASGRSLRLRLQRGDNEYRNAFQITIGALFFTVYFTFPVPESWILKRKCIATWDNNREFYLTDEREYGFYFYNWAFVWFWHAKVDESSARDPWWMRQYIRLDDLLLGQWHSMESEVAQRKDVLFRLGEKEFRIDSIKWKRRQRFRAHIPFALWHHEHYSVEMDIKNPPMYSGKGENSWDCGDDGTYGLSAHWDGPDPRWNNLDEITPMAVKLYTDGVLKYAKRYGGSSSAMGIRHSDEYAYIGVRA